MSAEERYAMYAVRCKQKNTHIAIIRVECPTTVKRGIKIVRVEFEQGVGSF